MRRDQMNNSKFSLILSINHNHQNYRRLIEQAQAQDYSNLEIIIITNRLNTKDQYIVDFLVCKDALKRSKHLSFLKRESLSSLCNEGISYASGNYAWCIDEDIDLNNKSTITNIVEKLAQSKAQAIYLSNEINSNKLDNLGLSSKTDNISLDHPVSLVNQDDWHNHRRLVINLESIKLFNLHFPEGWQHIHGKQLSLQIIRFLPNIYYYRQELVKFKTNNSSLNSKELTAHHLSLNYDLRYSELLFGAYSNTFKIILKREIKDSRLIFQNVNKSRLNSKIKDYLKYSRQTCLMHYINKITKNSKEISHMLLSVKDLEPNIKTKPSEMLNEFFKNSRIKIHCGAHKTATTYIQNILHEARYDLALQNTIYIHYEQLREDFIKAKQKEGITDTGERLAFAICKQSALLSFKLPRVIIISEENLIRPNTEIFAKWNAEATYQNACNYSCACMRNGYDLSHLQYLAKIFRGGIEIIYTVRSYFDYLLSRHSEFLKWRSFKEFDGDFIDKNDLQKCNWEYLISDLKKISGPTSIISFESYKSDPLKLANYFAEFDLSSFENKIKSGQAISRSRSSQALLDELITKNHIGFDGSKLRDIFSEKIENISPNEAKFESKLFPEMLLFDINTNYKAIYSTRDFQCPDNNYPSLSDKQFCESNFLETLPLPERAQLSLSRQSKELRSCLASISNKSLFLDGRFSSRPTKPGISAMIRIKNEEDTIYDVLNSIKNCFDEIVVIDNNSSDNTISEIGRAAKDLPQLKSKLKLHHYKFDIARCGIDNFKEDQSSPNSLAAFYNYSLKKCSFSKVCKWDGDMLLPSSMEKSFQDFIKQVSTTTPSSEDSTIYGVMKGLTVYKGMNSKFYLRPSVFEKEARIFDNTPGVFFVKEILWEQLFSLHSIERVISEGLTFVEFKDTSVNEFAHWSVDASLGMSPRKSKELRDFNIIKKITQYQKSDEIDKALQAHGFQEIDFDLFDFHSGLNS